MNGTPKTLQEAIMNGMQAATKRVNWNEAQKARFDSLPDEARKLAAAEMQAEQLKIIESHVLDFFRQKFGVAYLEMTNWFEDRTYKDPAGILRELAEATGVARS